MRHAEHCPIRFNILRDAFSNSFYMRKGGSLSVLEVFFDVNKHQRHSNGVKGYFLMAYGCNYVRVQLQVIF
jgi:hypothetical protein